MHDENEPTHPELLDRAGQGSSPASGFDLKYLVRGICNSEPTSGPASRSADNRDDRTLFSHHGVKVLSPRAAVRLADAGHRRDRRPGRRRGPRTAAEGRAGRRPRDQFVELLPGRADNANADRLRGRHPAGAAADELARSWPTARLTDVAVKAGEVTKGARPTKAIEKLYLTTLSRRPTADETKKMTEYVGKRQDAARRPTATSSGCC